MLPIEHNIENDDGTAAAGIPPLLFDGADDLLQGSLNVDHTISDFSIGDAKDDASASINGFDHLEFLQPYNESGPSSVHNGELLEVSETAGSHMSAMDERDVPWHDEHIIHARPAHIDSSSSNDPNGILTPATEVTVLQPDFQNRMSPIQEALLRNVTPDKPDRERGSKFRKPNAGNGSMTTSSHKSSLATVESLRPETPVTSENTSDTVRVSPYHSSPKRTSLALRPKSSIPQVLEPVEFARQCILAAESSRLNPFALHPSERQLLREHITHGQVTVYLNIRNAILRLWTRNPMVAVTKEEAAGCAKESRYFGLALVAYEWLLRNGYINFGCIELDSTAGSVPRGRSKMKRRVIAIVGAGMSGLGCARQIEGLVAQLGERFSNVGEKPPKVIILEGRKRIGGRVYSHQLKGQHSGTLPRGLRSTAEMGAMIVTGFEHGNPMNVLIRGQLGLHYHALRDNSVLYDYDGSKVDRNRDILVEKLYNDILERASAFRRKSNQSQMVEGDRDMIEAGRDSTSETLKTIAQLEDAGEHISVDGLHPSLIKGVAETGPAGVVGVAGRGYQLAATTTTGPAAQAVKAMGWQLKPQIPDSATITVRPANWTCGEDTLGDTMDDAITQYQTILDLTPQDMRLLNWHHANLEYANAANVSQLSLGYWDQDIGNEFEGEHTEIIGGYTQVPRGLWQCPSPLDVKFNSAVRFIKYNPDWKPHHVAPVTIQCENGDVLEVDYLVVTTPLGVLKSDMVQFDPPLPAWKQDAIERLGFGLLNKVVLVYEKPFWEEDRDIFGLLNDSEISQSSRQQHYSRDRGRFYLFWNCIKTSGRPMLIALMAGNAAHETEQIDTSVLVRQVTERLTKVFAPRRVPPPHEVIVTRWKSDRFARGSYSYMGPRAEAKHYDAMARPVGPLYFAGEATCGTHPATVHGAYLSGLRAASEVIESIIGPIPIEQPLVPARSRTEGSSSIHGSAQKRKLEDAALHLGPTASQRQARYDKYETAITDAILAQLGSRPLKPGRPGVNPFLLWQKDHWQSAKAKCDAARQRMTGNISAKASKNEIRSALAQGWRTASVEAKNPYLEATRQARNTADAEMITYKERASRWDQEAAQIRDSYVEKHRFPSGVPELFVQATVVNGVEGRKNRRSIDELEASLSGVG